MTDNLIPIFLPEDDDDDLRSPFEGPPTKPGKSENKAEHDLKQVVALFFALFSGFLFFVLLLSFFLGNSYVDTLCSVIRFYRDLLGR